MRCHYCFYRDEQQNRSTSEDCMMTLQTAETLIRHCFAELEPGGFVSFAFQGGEPTLAGLDFFRFFTQTVRKYNQKRVTVQYAIQTNGLAVAEEWARFFREENFLVGISLDGTPDVHDALRPDASGDGTWTRVMQTIKLLEQYHIECNLLCVVTKRLAKKAERVYKSMKATGVRYLQFIPCLDPLGAQRGIENYSLSPELYAQFLCALFDAWYRDWKTGVYVSVRLFEDFIKLLMGAPTGTCSTTGACGSYMVVEGSGAVYPCDFYCLDEYKLGTIQNDSLQSLLLGEKMRIFIKDGRNVPAECQQCRWVNLCHGGCKRDRNTADKAQRSYYCKALQKFFAYAEPRMREMARAGVRLVFLKPGQTGIGDQAAPHKGRQNCHNRQHNHKLHHREAAASARFLVAMHHRCSRLYHGIAAYSRPADAVAAVGICGSALQICTVRHNKTIYDSIILGL